MSIPQYPLQDQLQGFSRALFSTWLYHRRFNILFDAGEGVATTLCNRVFGIRRIFLSHGHADHIAGLVNLVNIRNLGGGDQTASLRIYFPKNNRLLEFLRDYLRKTQPVLSFKLEWIALDADQIIELEDQRSRVFIRTFKTEHSQKQLSLGYNIIEKRRKLRSQYQGLSQKELNAVILEKGRDEIAETVEQIIFSYGGDSRPINPDLVRGSLFLCHEATYMSVEDDERNFQQHSFLDDVLVTAAEAEVKTVLLFHTSLRYNLDELRGRIKEGIERIKPNCRVLVMYGDSIVDPIKNNIWRGRGKKRKIKNHRAD